MSWWDEDDGAGSGGEEDVKGPPTKAEAEAALLEFIVGNYMRGKERWTAEDVCVVAYWASIIGDTVVAANKHDPSLKALGRAPGTQTQATTAVLLRGF